MSSPTDPTPASPGRDHAAEFRLARVVIDIPVAWGEMDALGHVNNVAYYRYIESARVEYLRRIGHERLGPAGAGFILQSASVRFRRPLDHPDIVRVSARAVHVGPDRFTLAHAVFSTAKQEVAAVGESVIVSYDYGASAKAPLPSATLASIRALDGGLDGTRDGTALGVTLNDGPAHR